MATKTYAQCVDEYIKTFGSISSMEAFADLGITRLSAVVFCMNNGQTRESYPHVYSVEESCRNRYGKRVFYSRYSYNKPAEESEHGKAVTGD